MTSRARRSREARSVVNPDFFDRLYGYAWFVTFGLSFGAYLLFVRQAGPGESP